MTLGSLKELLERADHSCATPFLVAARTSLSRRLHTRPVPILGDLFARYEPAIRSLPRDRALREEDLAGETFLLDRDGKLEIYYAPMDWLRTQARVAVVGITPGAGTMLIAFQTVVDGLVEGLPAADALDNVKRRASFSGFRPQLVEWLTWLGVPAHLGHLTEADTWQAISPFLHPTSAVRYPAFVAGRNYSGRGPDLARNATLRRYLFDLLVPELAEIPDALIVPLGDKVSETLLLLAAEGLLDEERCLVGFPHPSGNNGHRMRKWNENREGLKRKTATWFAAHPMPPLNVQAD